MIRHIVLFKLKPGYSQESPEVAVAEALAVQLGREVTSLRDWRFGRNFSNRPIAYDFAAVGLLDDEEALEQYLEDPFHRQVIHKWREISDCVIADVREDDINMQIHDSRDQGQE